MHPIRTLTVALASAVVVVTLPAQTIRIRTDRNQQTQRNAFEWSGELARGNRIVLRNLNGSVTVSPARGRELEVVAHKTWRHGNPANVTVDATRINGGRDVLVCARWNQTTRCDENGYETRGRGNDNNDTQVEFVIHLPAGADAFLNTTNGDIEVTGATAAVDAETTNGDVKVQTSDGPVTAGTTNGDLILAFAKLPPRGSSYGTTNGDVTITLPDGVDADIAANTTNGGISTDFSITASGSMSRRHLRGRIGRGGPLLELQTTNGSIRIEKR